MSREDAAQAAGRPPAPGRPPGKTTATAAHAAGAAHAAPARGIDLLADDALLDLTARAATSATAPNASTRQPAPTRPLPPAPGSGGHPPEAHEPARSRPPTPAKAAPLPFDPRPASDPRRFIDEERARRAGPALPQVNRELEAWQSERQPEAVGPPQSDLCMLCHARAATHTCTNCTRRVCAGDAWTMLGLCKVCAKGPGARGARP